MQHWPNLAGRDKFYGDPRGKNGAASVKWEAENLVNVKAPWDMWTAWETSAGNRTKIGKGVRVHRNVAASLARVFDAIWKASGESQAVIDSWGMHLLGGGYTFRLQRGGATLSNHSWGCAVDFDPARNGMGDHTPHFSNCPAVLKAFSDEGWRWGGHWSRPDAMHFEAIG